MSPLLGKLLFRTIRNAIFAGWLTNPVRRLKIRAVAIYLKAVDGVRKGVIGAVGLILVLMLLITGFVAIHVGLLSFLTGVLRLWVSLRCVWELSTSFCLSRPSFT